ncbi:choline/ethanolamine transporter flvcr2b [Parasteatoda tepidariorum]|uniref:choline/ethanolamine transporter flvcr2b n=1 Tax=Parasteatoda tepidariorum TaxID=114398 RepID=UPI001C721B1A|nr:feline leukemia virus subgroup C receptor-related protein 2 [Parasteatoda tepidariorum]
MTSKIASTTDHATVNFDPNYNVTEIKVYKRRFWMLFLFSFLSFLCGMLYPQYVVMADMNTCYYNVTQNAVNWTSMLYMVVYIILVFPASSIIDRIDLRWTVICGSLFNTLSAALQILTLKQNSFPFVIVSTFSASLTNLAILGIPPFIASRWFPSNEVSRACAIGVFGNQLGIGIGFIFSPLLVSSDCKKKEDIEVGKETVATILTAMNTVLLLLIVLTFQNAPKLPPSINECQKKSEKSVPQLKIIWKMLKNLNFILVLLVYGLMAGCYFAFATTLNDLILRYFPNKSIEVGWMGLVFIFTGLIGSVVAGCILDYTHKYKETYAGICILSLVLYVAFSLLLFVNMIWVQFLMIGILGIFFTSFLPVGFEYGIEVTYPASEVLSASLLNASTMGFGLILTMLVSTALDSKGSIWFYMWYTSDLLYSIKFHNKRLQTNEKQQ